MKPQAVSFVVGEEKRLTEILHDGEVLPLLKGTVKAGATEVTVCDENGVVLWQERNPAGRSEYGGSLPLHLEGEPVGKLVVKGERSREEFLKGIAGLLLVALNTIIGNNLKRMLTTEIHTTVVNQSYDELLESNRCLAESEHRYRELAESLEQQVEERTGELKRAHARLLEQEKLASVGQLAAGVAHEINNPMGFITSNLATLQKYVARFVVMLDYYRGHLSSDDEMARQAGEKWRELKLDMVRADVGDLLSQSLAGAERVKKIVADLKGFSHIDEVAEGETDVNAEIERTLSVMTHGIPGDAEIVRDFGQLPSLCCNPARLCQAFLNIIQNAIQARPDGLRLAISTRFSSDNGISVSLSDNGPGIPPEIRKRIFDPFFTTREVGAGTGMGLAVVYEVVTSLGGAIDVACPAEGGTTFSITLPVRRN